MKTWLWIILLFPLSVYAADSDYNSSWNLRTSPIAWVIGPNLRLDFRATDSWTIGATGVILDSTIKTVALSGTVGGVILCYNFSGALKDSWFIDAGETYGSIRAQASSSSGQLYNVHLSNWTEHLLGGYHWFWGHFNLAAGAGLDVNSAGGQEIDDGNGNRVAKVPVNLASFASEVSIGLAF